MDLSTGRMSNAGRKVKDQVIWNIYYDTLTYKDFEHMAFSSNGEEMGIQIHQRRQASYALGSFEENQAVFNPNFYQILMGHILQSIPPMGKLKI